MARQAPIVLLAMALGLSACSREASDWRPVLVDELKGSPNYEHRLGPAGDYLSATGDFNGDGIGDRVALMRDDVAGLVEFMAVLGGQNTYYTVSEFPIAELGRMGVNALRPGVYPRACVDADMKPMTCATPPEITFEKDALDVFAFNAHGRFIYWIGGGFVIVGISE